MKSILACEDSFTKDEQTYSDGGEGQASSVDTIDKCKEACRDDDECLGFDWTLADNADTRCWLHNDKDKFEDNGDSSTSDQYTRTDCKGKNMSKRMTDNIIMYSNIMTIEL